MHLIYKGPFTEPEDVEVDEWAELREWKKQFEPEVYDEEKPPLREEHYRISEEVTDAGFTLAAFSPEKKDVKAVSINGRFVEDWERYVPGPNDTVEFFIEAGWVMVIMMVIMIIMQIIMQLLAPKPKVRDASAAQPSIGIAGVTNTVSPGTCKFGVIGIREVFGHLIAGKTTLTEPATDVLYKRMSFSAMYFMGFGPIKNILDPKVNGTQIIDIPGAGFQVRLGTPDQDIFEGHEIVNMPYAVGLQIGIPTRDDPSIKDPLVVTTRSACDRATITINFPTGIFGTKIKGGDVGGLHDGWYNFTIRYKLNGEDAWITYNDPQGNEGWHFQAQVRDGVFTDIVLDFPVKGRYDISVQCTLTRTESQDSGPPVWFNTTESQLLRTAYPGNSLLLITGVDSNQINSFDSMAVSATVHGLISKVWDADCNLFVENFHQSRAFAVRYIMTNVENGMGASFDERLINDGSLIDAYLNYESDQVTGYSGLEDRDHCDVILKDQRPGSDWVKNLCFEGDTRLIQSRGQLKYVIDRGDAPEMRKFSEPDGIVSGSLNFEFGRNDRPVNVIYGEFANESDQYKVVPCRLELLGGLNGAQEIRQDASYVSITRASQVARRMRRDLNKINIIDQFFDWKAPKSAMLSEVYDPIWLHFLVPEHLRGYSGFVGPDSTTTVVNLNQEVVLDDSTIYHLYVQNVRKKAVQERVVTTAFGTVHHVTVSSAFTVMEEGDAWMLGVPATQIFKVLLEETKRDKDGTYDLKGSIILPEVYEIDDPLPVIVDNINAVITETFPFQPIKAQVINTAGNAAFKVAPGFDHYRGTAVDTTASYIQLPATEPAINDFFKDYTVQIGAAIKRRITTYDGASRAAFYTDDPGVTGPAPYRMTAPEPGKFAGYSVEESTTPTGPWSFLTSAITHEITVASYGASTNYFRLTPISTRGFENIVGRWIIQISAGDFTAPDPAASVDITQANKVVHITVVLNMPLERDVRRVNVYLHEDSPVGATLSTTTMDASVLRDEDNDSGTKELHTTVDMTAEADGTLIYAVTTVEDWFGNASTTVDSPVGVELVDLEEDEELVDATNAGSVTVTNTTTETVIAGMSIPGGGLGTNGIAILNAWVHVTDDAAVNDATLTLRLKFKGTTVVTMVVMTSDLVSFTGTDVYWHLIGYLMAKSAVTDPLLVLERNGRTAISDAPYPGATSESDGAIATGASIETTGDLQISVQWSVVDTGLSITKEFSWQNFVVNA